MKETGFFQDAPPMQFSSMLDCSIIGRENIDISQAEIHHQLPPHKVKSFLKIGASKPKPIFQGIKPRKVDIDDVGVKTPKDSDIFTPTYSKSHIQLPSKELVDETILDITHCGSTSSNGVEVTTNATKQSTKGYQPRADKRAIHFAVKGR